MKQRAGLDRVGPRKPAIGEEYCWKGWFFGQPMGSCRSSGRLGVARMPLGRNVGKGIIGTVWLATVPSLVVLSSLLVAQDVPFQFSATPSAQQCSIRASSAQCQTQRFDSDGLQWIAPVSTFVILPSAESANWNFRQQLLPGIQTKGFHFNRPPPAN